MTAMDAHNYYSILLVLKTAHINHKITFPLSVERLVKGKPFVKRRDYKQEERYRMYQSGVQNASGDHLIQLPTLSAGFCCCLLGHDFAGVSAG